MNRQDRKAAISAYKEIKTASGVYAVTCSATGETWVGSSRHLDTQQNGLWFQLRLGSARNPQLQAAWNQHGADAFSFEALERLPDDLSDMARKDELKRREAAWREQLDARAI
jgi:hypothetical protein